jgi:hypothetical protein
MQQVSPKRCLLPTRINDVVDNRPPRSSRQLDNPFAPITKFLPDLLTGIQNTVFCHENGIQSERNHVESE